MIPNFEKVDQKFKLLTDLLLFSSNDINADEYKQLFLLNNDENFKYFWDRFVKSLNISFDSKHWNSRFSFLFSLKIKKINHEIKSLLERRVRTLLGFKLKPDPKYDNEFLQFLELCRVLPNESLNSFKKYFISFSAQTQNDKYVYLLNKLIPFVFLSIDEFIQDFCKRKYIDILSYEKILNFNKLGISFDKKPLIKYSKFMLENCSFDHNSRTTFYQMISDPEVFDGLKLEYDSSKNRKNLLFFIKRISFYESERWNYKNIKNIIELDPSIVDEVVAHYAQMVYDAGYNHKMASVDKLISLINFVPQISIKNILLWMSKSGHTGDIKYIISKFPEFKGLSMFV